MAIEGFTDEEIAQILSTVGMEGETSDLENQLKQAQALRNTQVSPTTQAGNVIIANPAGAISGMFQRGQGKAQEKQVRGQMDASKLKQQQAVAAYLRGISKEPAPAPTPVVPPAQNPSAMGL